MKPFDRDILTAKLEQVGLVRPTRPDAHVPALAAHVRDLVPERNPHRP